MRILKQLVLVVVVSVAGSAAVQAAGWNTPLTFVLGLATAALTLAAYAWVVRRTERREPAEVALRNAPAALGRGLHARSRLVGRGCQWGQQGHHGRGRRRASGALPRAAETAETAGVTRSRGRG